MNFDLTDEQQMLADTARELLSRSYDTESRNKTVESDLGWSREVWNQLAEIGILGLGFDPEEAGPIEVMAVMTEMGRRLAPEPVAAAALIPALPSLHTAPPSNARCLTTWPPGNSCWPSPTEHDRRGSTELSTRAVRQGDSWTLNGRKNPVLAGDCADVLIVSAALPGGGSGLFLVDAGAATRHPYRTFDGQRGAEVILDDAPARPLGNGGEASGTIAEVVARFQSALCAEAVGAMDESLRLTTDYLKSRKQFGVPLKTFQTLTQRAADMYVSLEQARSMNFYAAMYLAEGSSTRWWPRGPNCRSAVPAGTLHRVHPAARRHRRDRGVPDRPLRRSIDRNRPDVRICDRPTALPQRPCRRLRGCHAVGFPAIVDQRSKTPCS